MAHPAAADKTPLHHPYDIIVVPDSNIIVTGEHLDDGAARAAIQDWRALGANLARPFDRQWHVAVAHTDGIAARIEQDMWIPAVAPVAAESAA